MAQLNLPLAFRLSRAERVTMDFALLGVVGLSAHTEGGRSPHVPIGLGSTRTGLAHARPTEIPRLPQVDSRNLSDAHFAGSMVLLGTTPRQAARAPTLGYTMSGPEGQCWVHGSCWPSAVK